MAPRQGFCEIIMCIYWNKPSPCESLTPVASIFLDKCKCLKVASPLFVNPKVLTYILGLCPIISSISPPPPPPPPLLPPPPPSLPAPGYRLPFFSSLFHYPPLPGLCPIISSISPPPPNASVFSPSVMSSVPACENTLTSVSPLKYTLPDLSSPSGSCCLSLPPFRPAFLQGASILLWGPVVAEWW